MKNSNVLIIALICMIAVCVSLLLYAIHLRHVVSVLREDGEEVTILDGGNKTSKEKAAKNSKKDGKDQTPSNDFTNPTGNSMSEDEILEESLGRCVDSSTGSWDIWTESLRRGTFTHNTIGDVSGGMISASLIKIFVMGAVYREIEEGDLREDEVYSDVHNMIIISDNDSANRLIRKLGGGDPAAGMNTVNEFAAGIGCVNTRLNRLMLAENGLENYTSAEDCARMLRLIYHGSCVSQRASEAMMSHLKAQTVNDRIPRGVPEGTLVAHKTGNLTNRANGDVGIVFVDNGDYILCAINNGGAGDGTVNEIITDLSSAAYNYYMALS